MSRGHKATTATLTSANAVAAIRARWSSAGDLTSVRADGNSAWVQISSGRAANQAMPVASSRENPNFDEMHLGEFPAGTRPAPANEEFAPPPDGAHRGQRRDVQAGRQQKHAGRDEGQAERGTHPAGQIQSIGSSVTLSKVGRAGPSP